MRLLFLTGHTLFVTVIFGAIMLMKCHARCCRHGIPVHLEWRYELGTCTTDALVEMLHKWYESTDVTGNFVRVLFLDYSKAFDLINHDILLNKMVGMEVPANLVRWMAAFLVDREQRLKVGDAVSKPGYPNGGVPQGTLSEPKLF